MMPKNLVIGTFTGKDRRLQNGKQYYLLLQSFEKGVESKIFNKISAKDSFVKILNNSSSMEVNIFANKIKRDKDYFFCPYESLNSFFANWDSIKVIRHNGKPMIFDS